MSIQHVVAAVKLRIKYKYDQFTSCQRWKTKYYELLYLFNNKRANTGTDASVTENQATEKNVKKNYKNTIILLVKEVNSVLLVHLVDHLKEYFTQF